MIKILEGTDPISSLAEASDATWFIPHVEGSDKVLCLMLGMSNMFGNISIAKSDRRHVFPRHYHGPRHVGRMWQEYIAIERGDTYYTQYRSREMRDTVAYFAWYHDAALCAGPAGQSEHLSAMCFSETMATSPDCLEPKLAHTVTQAILYTAQHTSYMPWLSDSIKLLLDLDLAELGTDRYTINGELIRKEYDYVDHMTFVHGRIKFLQAMLAREKIYYNPCFADREGRARENIQADLNLLGYVP